MTEEKASPENKVKIKKKIKMRHCITQCIDGVVNFPMFQLLMFRLIESLGE